MIQLYSGKVMVEFTFGAASDTDAAVVQESVADLVRHEMDSSIAGDSISSFSVNESGKPKGQSLRPRALGKLANQGEMFTGAGSGEQTVSPKITPLDSQSKE